MYAEQFAASENRSPRRPRFDDDLAHQAYDPPVDINSGTLDLVTAFRMMPRTLNRHAHRE